jgi:hypothetical protein
MGPNSVVTVRCLPVEDDGLLQLSGTDADDAIMGDVDTEPRPGMGQQQGQEGRAQTAGVHCDKLWLLTMQCLTRRL